MKEQNKPQATPKWISILEGIVSNSPRIFLIILICLFAFVALDQCNQNKRIEQRLEELGSKQNQKAINSRDTVYLSNSEREGELYYSYSQEFHRAESLHFLTQEQKGIIDNLEGRVEELLLLEAEVGFAPVDTVFYAIPQALGDSLFYWDWLAADSGYFVEGHSAVMLDSGKVHTAFTRLDSLSVSVDMLVGFRERGGYYEAYAKPLSKGISIGKLTGARRIEKPETFSRWGVSAYVGVGLNQDLRFSPQVGAGISYTILRFKKR